MTIRIAVCDDELIHAEYIRSCLSTFPYISVICTTHSVKDIYDIVRSKKVDAVFLDINIEGENGIQLAKNLRRYNNSLKIVFITASDTYYSDAFELYASDYLMKPIDLDRLGTTCSKLKQDIQNLKYAKAYKENIKKTLLTIEYNKETYFIDTEKIIFLTRQNNNTIIYTIEDDYTTNKSLSSLESKLPSLTFIRTHKSFVVNLKYVDKISNYGRWTYLITFRNSNLKALLTRNIYLQLKDNLL